MAKEKLIPLRDFLVVQPLQENEKTNSGLLYIPRNAKVRELRAEVLAVGPGRHLENGQVVPVAVKPGDIVLASEYRFEHSNGFNEVGRGERPPIIIPEGDVLAVIEAES